MEEIKNKRNLRNKFIGARKIKKEKWKKWKREKTNKIYRKKRHTTKGYSKKRIKMIKLNKKNNAI